MSQSRILPWITLLIVFAFGASAALVSAADDNATDANNANQADTSNQADQAQLSEEDQAFVKEAAQGGLLEVQLGQYAAQHASDASVKSFGQRMVTDHSRVNKELAELGRKHQWNVPTQLDEKHQKMLDKLTDKEGEDFDKAYMEAMLKDHREDIQLLEKETQNGKNAELKRFVATSLPIFRQHLQLAQGIASKLGIETENHQSTGDQSGNRAGDQNGTNNNTQEMGGDR